MLYVGHTQDVASRIQKHADGSGSRQAKQLKESILVFIEGAHGNCHGRKTRASDQEMVGAKKIALIRDDLETLKSLSKSREA